MKLAGLEAMKKEADRFVATLAPHVAQATVVALSGDLGAGKTTFAQSMARALGVNEKVTSPTFVLEKMYKLYGQSFAQLIHIDAYRLLDAHELEILGWSDMCADPQNLILIEWPERVASLIPASAIRISLEGVDESREITYE